MRTVSTSARSLALLALTAILVSATDAGAIRYQARPDWMLGFGWGTGRGTFEDPTGDQTGYRDGAAPQIHFGRVLGRHFMVSAEYKDFLVEFGEIPIKIRRTLQNFALGLAVFPGNQDGASGGIYLRGGVGVGWAGTGVKEVIPGTPQDEGERHDEWGVGAFGEAGYEFWVNNHFTIGVGAGFNYFDIGDTIVDKAWFGAGAVNVNLYW